MVGLVARSTSAFPSWWSSTTSNDTNVTTTPATAVEGGGTGLHSLTPYLLNFNFDQMANLAMNPALDNQTLTELFLEANEITNVTGADSVLMELDPVDDNNQTIVTSPSDNVIVLAVTNPTVPSHEDLLERFRLYFVNTTAASGGDIEKPEVLNDGQHPGNYDPSSRPTLWNIFQNFLKNQANAVIGAFMLPFNVATNAMLTSAHQHAEYVMTGSAFGSAISAPIILKAIAIPNYIAQRVIDFDAYKVGAVESTEERTKQMADSVVDNGPQFFYNGTMAAGQMAHRYMIRPIGAFTGFNLNLAGSTLTSVGQGLTGAGVQLNLLSDSLTSGAEKAVSAGAKAIAWGLDQTVQLYPNPMAEASTSGPDTNQTSGL